MQAEVHRIDPLALLPGQLPLPQSAPPPPPIQPVFAAINVFGDPVPAFAGNPPGAGGAGAVDHSMPAIPLPGFSTAPSSMPLPEAPAHRPAPKQAQPQRPVPAPHAPAHTAAHPLGYLPADASQTPIPTIHLPNELVIEPPAPPRPPAARERGREQGRQQQRQKPAERQTAADRARETVAARVAAIAAMQQRRAGQELQGAPSFESIGMAVTPDGKINYDTVVSRVRFAVLVGTAFVIWDLFYGSTGAQAREALFGALGGWGVAKFPAAVVAFLFARKVATAIAGFILLREFPVQARQEGGPWRLPGVPAMPKSD